MRTSKLSSVARVRTALAITGLLPLAMLVCAPANVGGACGFNYVQLSSSGRSGSANPMYGLLFWNLDARLGKSSPATFGVITATYTPPNRTNAARWIEMGLRLDF